MYIHVFRSGEVWATTYSIFPPPLSSSGILQCTVSIFNDIPCNPHVLFIFLHSFFCPSDWIILAVPSSLLILSFACSNLLFNLSSEFFISVIVLLTSRISVWFLYVISMLIVSFGPYIILISFSFFVHGFF